MYKKTLVSIVSDKIRENIEKENWKLGEKLPSENELAEELGVGRNTVREAIKLSEYSGLIKTYKGKGSFVNSKDSFSYLLIKNLKNEKLNDIIEVRYLLEEKGIVLAAKNRTKIDLLRLKSTLVQREKELTNSHIINSLIESEYMFHVSIIEASHNELLIKIYKSVMTYIKETIYFANSDSKAESIEWCIHDNMYQAVVNQDVKEAKRAIQKHYKLHFDYLDKEGVIRE